MTVYFIGAGPGAPGSDHAARRRAAAPLPGVPIRRIAGARGNARPVPEQRGTRQYRADAAGGDRRANGGR